MTAGRAPCRFAWGVAVALSLGSCDRSRIEDFAKPCINCKVAERNLNADEVERIVAQAITEANVQNRCVTVAVVDRLGNALAVYEMTAGPCKSLSENVTILSGLPGRPADGLEGLPVPAWEAALAKAITGAYLSSSGNAFSTRTASYIIQEHFPPLTDDQPSGPLFGVQFSQLSCSDVVKSRIAADPTGPQRSPLGLAGSPGGLPLYKQGIPVGGIGVAQRGGTYKLGLDLADPEENDDERVAFAGSFGFTAPESIRANRISVGATTLRYAISEDTVSNPADASTNVLATAGRLMPAPGFFDAAEGYRFGVAFGSAASGITESLQFGHLGGYELVDAAGANRFPPKAGASGLTANDVEILLRAALSVAGHTRGQIRHPQGSTAQVTISVVDANGDILGIVRTPDAPVFGIDVSAQKARTAAFFSRNDAQSLLAALGEPVDDYPAQASALLGGDPFGAKAFSSRSIGNLARPLFPDGIDGRPNGPLSKPLARWSPFNDGLQFDLVELALLAAAISPGDPALVNQGCSGNPAIARSGFQIFPGGMPILKGGKLAGAIGLSGDGVDQDDMVAFLGLYDAGVTLSGAISHPLPANRADSLSLGDSTLRYVQCPFAPFVDETTTQNVCDDK